MNSLGLDVATDPATGAMPARSGPSLRLAPNPFNPRTRLIASSPVTCAVRLEAYDAAGHSLGTVWSGTIGPAPITLDWHGEDAAGRRLPSGSYLFSLATPGQPPLVVRGLLLR